MPEPKIDFEPEIDFQPDEKPSAISRFGKGLMDLPISMYNQVNEAGKHGAEQIREGDYPGALDTVAGFITQPFKQLASMLAGNAPVQGNEAARAEGINQVGGLVGLPMNEARQAYSEGDYARLIGQALGAAGMFALPHIVSSHGAPAPHPIEEVPQPRAIRGLLPEHNETYAGPFIAGDAGVALNKPYTIDLSHPLPGDMMSGSGTIHPTEADGLNQIPPDLAAREGLNIGRPAYQFNKPFEHDLMKKVAETAPEQLGEHTVDFEPIHSEDLPTKIDEAKVNEPINVDTEINSQQAKTDEAIKSLEEKKEALHGEIVDSDFEQGKELGRILQRLANPKGQATEQALGPTEISSIYKGPELKLSSRDRRNPSPQGGDNFNTTKKLAEETTTKIVQAIHDASLPREKQEAIYTQTRGQRMGKALKVKETGQAGFQKQLGKLSGKMKHVGVEPLGNSLEQPEIDSLFDHVTNSGLDFWKQITAKRAISKLLTGEHVPQRNELKLLRQVFGNQLADTIELHAGLFVPPSGPEARAAITNTANVMKSFMTSIDFSAPLRQGLPLIGRKEFWNSLLGMVKSGFSEEYFQKSQEGLRDRPLFDMGENVGLKLTELSGDITKREEAFISDLAERTPYVGRFVRGSNRAYIDFLNHLRADSFDNMVRDAGTIANNGEEGLKISSDIAKFINVSTGRGDLGRLERIATDLNSALFSPRMIASRLTMLNPMYYERLNPMVRKQALKALFSVAAAGGTFVGLGVAAGGRTSTDPTSADFMKLRLGNVRLDPYAGFQQYIVAANRLLAGARAGTDITTTLKQFGENKLSPMASFIDTLAKGKNAFPPSGLGGAIGPNRISGELINRFTPMIFGDIIDVAKENPELLPLTVPLGVLGMSTQDYPDKQTGGFRQMGMRKLR